MDIGNITGSYADLFKTQSSQAAAKIEGSLDTDYAKASDTELMEACKQFESYFIEQMFKEMAKTIPQAEETSSSTASLTDYYKDSMIQEIASSSTKQDNLGLAQMLFEQMKRNYGL